MNNINISSTNSNINTHLSFGDIDIINNTEYSFTFKWIYLENTQSESEENSSFKKV